MTGKRWSDRIRGLGRLTTVLVLASLAGCAALPRNAVPPELMAEAAIPGMPDARATAGRRSAAFEADFERSFAQESPKDFPAGSDGVVRYAHLALSGGGPNGAFGAGLVNGWTASGTRPVFKVVTGVSTGALMAPFVFLGPEHDDSLRAFYTTTSSNHIFRMLSILPQLLGGESFADTAPLQIMIAQFVDEAFLAAVARAHASGRRLYIGSVDLDAQRFVVWNMGLIASSRRPEAVDLFRRIMLASASVPVAFPPVFFDVEAGGRVYDEMHVDGAVAANLFWNAGVLTFADARVRAGRTNAREDLYIVHNGQLVPTADVTRRSLRSIALRSFDVAARSAVVGDLFRVFAVTQRDDAGFHWITIPETVQIDGEEVFDPVAMGRLYEQGYGMAQRSGPPWTTKPPGAGRAGRGGVTDSP